MDNKESTRVAASETPTITPTRSNRSVFSHPTHRIIQNFLLIWLDTNIDETNDNFKNSFLQLRRIVASITTFTDAQECFDFLSEIKKQKAFMIVYGHLVQQIMKQIEETSQLDEVGTCGKDEAEILFTTHTIFRIDNIEALPEADRLYEIQITLVGDQDNDFSKHT
ncbi:unnamed protein product [Rotaria sordida]|uniref:Uncharacterized protein n=1 Tax=Rotaria sordida TaxID=392033 RepID=A0A819TYN7_9BILA|nr:unnamed protein product [Rotaria sordida]